jgi:hypothetical protein
MTTTKIFVRIDPANSTGFEVPGPIQMGKRLIFTEGLVLEEYDDATPGNGLPVNPDERLAGTHSGVMTLVRVAGAGDPFFPDGSELWAYDATYKFNALDDTPLQKGQVTAHGVVLVDNFDDWNNIELPIRFAITGGTGSYSTAHGKITEFLPKYDKLLDIEL